MNRIDADGRYDLLGQPIARLPDRCRQSGAPRACIRKNHVSFAAGPPTARIAALRAMGTAESNAIVEE